jgi:hypothetical protein
MREAIISTLAVQKVSEGRSVEVIAMLDAGAVVPGMFLHLPLNSMLDLTLIVAKVTHDIEGRTHIFLDCNDESDAAFVVAFNFENDTLWVTESGEA